MEKKQTHDVMQSAREVGGKSYEVSDYQSKTTVSNGLATTHEQVSDVYMEGTLGAIIEDSANAEGDLEIDGIEK
jgi:hypothetical protein